MPRTARIYLTDANHVAIAKSYRQKTIARSRFKSWEEKLLERPGLERLFGSLMCYIGYCRDDLDYVAEFRKLREYGFERALVYPVRFNTYHTDIRMGGLPPISLNPQEVDEIKKMGYDVAAWTWINEALDDGSDRIRGLYRKAPDGTIIKNWQIDQQVWNTCCSSTLVQTQLSALSGPLADLTWDHLDVVTCASIGECYATDHPNHPGYPMSRSEDREWLRKLLADSQADGRAVSSEGFNDAYSMEYDIGSVKAWPMYGPWPYWPVPLTMLVYHDSMIHSWWEMHSYNNYWHGHVKHHRFYEKGGGRPRVMAAMDALMGCPPDVFPFGQQYMWTGKDKETFAYRFRFEDPEVQHALKLAKPVAELHRQIGKLEMISHEILSEDGYVQESVFADGTRVVANFASEPRVVENREPMQAESWRVFR